MWENIEDMPRRSTVTMRDHPLAPSTRAAAGTLVVHGELFTVETSDRVEIVDLTDKIMAYAREFGIREGTLTLWSLHTTCALFIN